MSWLCSHAPKTRCVSSCSRLVRPWSDVKAAAASLSRKWPLPAPTRSSSSSSVAWPGGKCISDAESQRDADQLGQPCASRQRMKSDQRRLCNLCHRAHRQAGTVAAAPSAVTTAEVDATWAKSNSKTSREASWLERGASEAMGSAMASSTTKQW